MPSTPPSRAKSSSAPQSRASPSTAFQRLQDQIKWSIWSWKWATGAVPQPANIPNRTKSSARSTGSSFLPKQTCRPPDPRKLAGSGFPPQLENPERQGEADSADDPDYRGQTSGTEPQGILPRPMRVCVVGMPNVGKSSLINWLIGQKKTAVADCPGVTKGTQWVRVHPQLELLDTPGILPAGALSKDAALKLSLFNLLPAANYEVEHVARQGLAILQNAYPNLLRFVYPRLEPDLATLEEIAQRRNFLTSGGKPDFMRAAGTFLSDLRSGKYRMRHSGLVLPDL